MNLSPERKEIDVPARLRAPGNTEKREVAAEPGGAPESEPRRERQCRRGLFEDTVSAICYEVGRSQITHGIRAELPPYNDVTAFVLGQWRRMPRFLAWPIWIVTILFAVSGLPQGALFHRLASHNRVRQLESWRISRLGPRRSFVRFYRSLALLALYSRAVTPTSGE